MPRQGADPAFLAKVVPKLIDLWLEDYEAEGTSSDIVQTNAASFSYLFDIGRERLVAAWGVSRGRHAGQRDKGRMAGHSLSAGPSYHRGHAIPHTLGGPTDINLVPQLGHINTGALRKLEIEAVNTPGAFTSRTGFTALMTARRLLVWSKACSCQALRFVSRTTRTKAYFAHAEPHTLPVPARARVGYRPPVAWRDDTRE
jgi:hypothetical protein